MRASDSDRERVAEWLRNATGEGRLLAEELEERLGAALSARTYGELDALVADLPAPGRRRDRPPLWAQAGLALAGLLTVLAAVAVAAFVIAGLLATWVLWVALGWLLFGRVGRRAPLPPPRMVVRMARPRTPYRWRGRARQ